ncbi:hypothetical protein LJR251_005923 [Rhizobium rhizogenes]|uniref:hypothetical protein n=1 Tax=Rhizobium rhizogenes TaxID=359 RepID=UPI003ECE8C24
MSTFQFLIIRPDDLVVLGVRWSGFALQRQETGASHIIATEDNAAIILTFSPQVIGEANFREGDEQQVPFAVRSFHNQAGPSQLVFRVARGLIVPLTVEGILGALNRHAIFSSELAGDPESTEIEIPYGLFVSLVARSGVQVVADHPTLPVASRSSTVGLWQTRLRASDAFGQNAQLLLKPLRAPTGMDTYLSSRPEAPFPVFPPMREGHRTQILQHCIGQPPDKLPKVARLNLSAVGGTFRASAVWSDFEWDHDLILGRDQKVRFLSKGSLYPFGHRATFSEMTVRELRAPPPHHHVSPPGAAHAGLHSQRVLLVTQPVSPAPTNDARLGREFPFDEVEILERRFDGIASQTGIFVPHLEASGQPLRFPIRCHGASGDLFFHVPLVFVPDFAAADEQALAGLWEPYSQIPLPGVAIDLVRAVDRAESVDVQEVHGVKLGATRHPDGFRPRIEEFTAELPALRTLQPDSPSRVALKFHEDFLNAGDTAIPFKFAGQSFAVDFAEHPDRSGGLIAPKFAADVISRSMGPVPQIAFPDLAESALSAFDGATLLGLPLRMLIDLATAGAPRLPPKIVPVLHNGNPVGARMEWKLRLKSFGPLVANNSMLDLSVEISPERSETKCRIDNFAYEFPPGPGRLLTLHFQQVTFTQKRGNPPALDITSPALAFSGPLALVQDLARKVQELIGPVPPGVKATPEGITAGYSLGIPSVGAGMFTLRNVMLNLGVDVPFSDRPVTASVSFGRRDNPFGVTVMGLGGGGYIDVRVGGEGIKGFEASLEFGAMVAIDFIIASAEVHAFGGIRFIDVEGDIALQAFIRIGGSVEILGLISISVELLVQLTYDSAENQLIGQASIVVEIDLTLFSETVSLDSGKWTLGGSEHDAPSPVERRRHFAAWQRYQGAFAA